MRERKRDVRIFLLEMSKFERERDRGDKSYREWEIRIWEIERKWEKEKEKMRVRGKCFKMRERECVWINKGLDFFLRNRERDRE